MVEFECKNIGEDAAVFQMPPGLDKRGLLAWYNQTLQFPYFGFNWDSLYDLLNDLNWIKEKHIWICHTSLPNMPEDQLLQYVNIICDTIKSWDSDPSHVFHASFPVSAKSRLSGITK
jgi:hypothetical protein